MRLEPLGLVTLWGLLCVPCFSQAHDHEPLKAGARVRLFAPSVAPSTIVGTITFADRDSLRFRYRATDVSMSRGDLTRAWISEGSRSRVGEGMLIGVTVGAVVGFVVAADYEHELSGSEHLVTAALFGVGGLLLGGLVGVNVRTDDWREVPLVARVGSASITVVPRRESRSPCASESPAGRVGG